MVKRLQYIIIFLFFAVSLVAQEAEQIQQKNIELEHIRSNIRKLKDDLKNLAKQEKESWEMLSNMKKQEHLYEKLVRRYESEERIKTGQIKKLREEIKQVEKETGSLKKKYSDYIVWLYKHGAESRLKTLFGSGSITRMLRRYKYLNHITEFGNKNLEELKDKKKELQRLSALLSDEVKERQRLIEEKNIEIADLQENRKEKETLINRLKEDSIALKRDIEEQDRARLQIQKIIAKLEEERLRKERLARENKNKGGKSYTQIYEKFENFAALKGKLAWPVKYGKIIKKFGENKNERLNTVTLNYGIDILTNKESDVFAVAEGLVSAIEWIPGYGSVVILTHKGNYRTVYGNLTDLKISEGDKIKGGKKLGRSSKSLDGPMIHFEIWKERSFQNPSLWLTRK